MQSHLSFCNNEKKTVTTHDKKKLGVALGWGQPGLPVALGWGASACILALGPQAPPPLQISLDRDTNNYKFVTNDYIFIIDK